MPEKSHMENSLVSFFTARIKWRTLNWVVLLRRTDNSDNSAKNIPTIQPETIQPVLQNARFERKNIGIGVFSRFKVAGERARRTSPLRGDNRLQISYRVLPSVDKLATSWRDCGGHYYWLKCLNFKSAELSLAELSGRGFYNDNLT